MIIQIKLVVFALFTITSHYAYSWSATGHHVIAVLAFDRLDEADQVETMRILSAHPDFDRRFRAPKGITDPAAIDRWRIGVAGCWPDIIRRSPQDRPTWHFQLGASVVIGDVTPPDDPGPLPIGATMDTQDLYIGQAFHLCRKVFADQSRPDAERAIALCWLCHLVADGHQPCHAGSLYAEGAFPEGDRGANSLRMGRGNIHSTWDNLLGGNASIGDVRRRVTELQADKETTARLKSLIAKTDNLERWLAASTWLAESRQLAKQSVYTPEVLEAVTVAMRGLTDRVELPKLPEAYFENAGKVARVRAIEAGYRLCEVISGVQKSQSK